MTYGEHAEEAANALARLISLDEQPVAAVNIKQVLACREALLNALQDQLYEVGADRSFVATARMSVQDVTHNAVNLLDQIARDAPRQDEGTGMAPLEALTRNAMNSATCLWQAAAAATSRGTHDLQAARERPWLRDHGAGWYLVRDIANTLEAVIVLDDRLVEVGLLPLRDRLSSTIDRFAERMVTAQVARVASWNADSMAPDLAVAASTTASGDPAIHTINRVGDVAGAQRCLARLIRHVAPRDVFWSSEPGIAVATARAVAVGQGRLSAQFAVAAGLGPDMGDLKQNFLDRQLLLADVQARLSSFTDIEPRVNRRAVFQQQEIGTAVRRFPGNELTPAQLLDLAQATHEVTSAFAKAMRCELHRERSNIRVRTREGFRRPSRKHPLSKALTNLANAPAPRQPVSRWIGPQQRTALRAVLDATPTGRPLRLYSSGRRNPNAGWVR